MYVMGILSYDDVMTMMTYEDDDDGDDEDEEGNTRRALE